MEIKKSPKADLEGSKVLGVLMGIVVALAVLFVGFEWGSTEIQIATASEGVADILAEEEIEITRQEEAPPPPAPEPVQQQVDIESLNVVEDDVEVANIEIISSEDTQAAAQVQTYVAPTIVEEEEESEQHIFTIVEKDPEFPGGQAEMLKWIQKTMRYPVIAQENGIQGRVSCQFVVNRDGSVVDAIVVRGVDPALDKEALRVISLMPKWTPGEQRGKPVRVRFNLPILFRLQ